MYPILIIFLVLGILSMHASGASLGMPGEKLPLAKRMARIPRTLQEYSFYKRDLSSTSPLEKKGTLETRQEMCSAGTTSCPKGGCCDGPCCGDGCCPTGYNCQFVGNAPGCCPIATTCKCIICLFSTPGSCAYCPFTDQISGCTNSGYVECSGFAFCCPAGQACSLDASSNAQCNGISIGNAKANTTPAAAETPSDPASPPLSPTTMPIAGGNTSVDLGGTATTAPSNTLSVTTANAVTLTRSVNNGNTEGTPLPNGASAQFGRVKVAISAIIGSLLSGLMSL